MQRRLSSWRAAAAAVALAVLAGTTSVPAQLTWVERLPGASPPAIGRVAMAYDTARLVTVALLPAHADRGVWEWNGSAWTQRTFLGAAAVDTAALAYDSQRRTMVAVGWPARTGSTWEWDGTTLRVGAIPHAATGYVALAYDAARSRTWLFGGYYNIVGNSSGYTYSLYGWTGGAWQQPSFQGPGPSARAAHAMAYDAARQRLVLFGGFDGIYPLGDTWEWDGTRWFLHTPANVPPARHGHAMAYDSDRRRVILFGGYNGAELNDLWEWDGTNWFRIATPTGPSPRHGHGLVYDTARKRLVLFGGISGFVPVNDTWELYDATVASFNTFGQGCSGSAGVPSLVAAPGQVPRVGNNFTVNIGNLPPAASTFVYLGLSKNNWGPLPLPFDLGLIGMPSCLAYTSGNLIYSTPNLTGNATWTIRLGSGPGLLGLRFYLQALVTDPPANVLGATVSNAGEAVIGS